jgi:RNA polymerase sigma factor (sigma-70 family)
MRKKEFSCHLKTLTPDLNKLIHSMRRNRYFGWMDRHDLLQEAMITLYMKVPKHYKKEKGSLKNYCLAAAKNCLRRIANQQYRHQQEMGVDWSKVCDRTHGNDNSDLQSDLYTQASKKIRVEQDTKKVLFEVTLKELAKINNDFKILQSAYEHDSDRQALCKHLNISNATITKVYKRLRKHHHSFTITHTPMKEYVKNRVNGFNRKCINNNIRVNAQ